MPFEPPLDPRAARRNTITRWVTFALVALLIGLVGYLAWMGYIGSEQLANPPSPSTDCRTPGVAEGWVYEAINYDAATDAVVGDLPDQKHCAARNVPIGGKLEASDGVRLAGWYIPAGDGSPPTAPTVVLAHGEGGNKSTMLEYAALLHDRYNLVLFDFRHHGQSGGDQTTQGALEQEDVRAVVDWLKKAKKPDGIAVLGVSMGGASALSDAVTDRAIDAVILDSTYATLAGAVEARLQRQGYPLALPGAWASLLGALLRTGQDMSAGDPVQLIGRLDRPVLIIAGGRDREIGPHDARDLLAAARDGDSPSATLETCAGAGHGQPVETCRADYADWVLGFLDRSLTR
jgi:pimeloyl-ACP methyl ester carboxylesterase